MSCPRPTVLNAEMMQVMALQKLDTLKGQRKIFKWKQKLCMPKGFATGNLETDSRYTYISQGSLLKKDFAYSTFVLE